MDPSLLKRQGNKPVLLLIMISVDLTRSAASDLDRIIVITVTQRTVNSKTGCYWIFPLISGWPWVTCYCCPPVIGLIHSRRSPLGSLQTMLFSRQLCICPNERAYPSQSQWNHGVSISISIITLKSKARRICSHSPKHRSRRQQESVLFEIILFAQRKQ